MHEKESVVRSVSSLLIAIVLVFLALSVVAIYYGLHLGGSNGSLLLLIGFSGLALSTYMLLQTRRKIPSIVFKPYQIATTIICQKCGFKNIREFQRGDYIFKELEECPKCKEKMMISSIYREAEEKEKD